MRTYLLLVLIPLTLTSAASYAFERDDPASGFTFGPSTESAVLNEVYLIDANETGRVSRSGLRRIDGATRLRGKKMLLIAVNNASGSATQAVIEILQRKVLLIQAFRLEGDSLTPLTPALRTGQTQRPFKTSRLIIPVSLSEGENVIVLSVASQAFFKPELMIWSAAAFAVSDSNSYLIYGPYYGVLAFVLLFTLFLSLAFRSERVYLYYALYIVSVVVMFLGFNDIGLRYIWRGYQFFDYEMIVISGATSLLSFALFAREFFRNTISPRVRTWLTWFAYAFLIDVFISAFMFSSQFLQVIQFLLFNIVTPAGFFGVVAVISMRSLRNGFKPGIFIAVAVVFLLVGIIINLLRIIEWVPQTALTIHSVQIGNLLEIITLTLAIAYWFKNNYDERNELHVKVATHQVAMAREKERIARELHDNIGSQLSLVSMNLARLSREFSIDKDRVEQLHTGMNDTLVELRDTIWTLNKETVTPEELKDKIINLIWRLRQANSSIQYAVDSTGDLSDRQLRPTQAMNLYRIAQEAIMNAIRHSACTKISVTLTRRGTAFEISVKDNGRGLPLEMKDQQEHYGMQNMRRRSEEIPSTFRVDTEPGGGTEVVVVMQQIDEL